MSALVHARNLNDSILFPYYAISDIHSTNLFENIY